MSDTSPPAVDLAVNCYERTYRDVLAPGYLRGIAEQNRFDFAGVYVVINNVDSRDDAMARADALVGSGEITGYEFVADHLDEALRAARLRRRALGSRPYFVDYALAMALVGTSPYLLGWDAEVRLEQPADWVTGGVALLEERSDVFSCAPRWPARALDTLDEETISSDGPWRLGWGFSDQVWLLRRSELASPIWRKLAPASVARHASHPFTFEARMESYQRVARRFRATHSEVRYVHNDIAPVLSRLGESRFEAFRSRQLLRLGRVLKRLDSQDPRLRLP